MPLRGSEDSAGYDIFAIEDMTIPPSFNIYFPNDPTEMPQANYDAPVMVRTGLKAYMPKNEVLLLFSRSSDGKRGLVIPNSVGVIDADYVDNPKNEGEIMFMFWNLSNKNIEIEKGDKLGQGIFVKWEKVHVGDAHGETRNGGIGSTGR